MLIAILLGLLVVIGVGGIALLGGRRRREEEPTPALAMATEAGTDVSGPTEPLAPAEPPLPITDQLGAREFAARINAAPEEEPPPRHAAREWEAYADIDHRPIGTSDDIPPTDYQRRPPGELGSS